jgi:hypothetical protein
MTPVAPVTGMIFVCTSCSFPTLQVSGFTVKRCPLNPSKLLT